ncbi:MAG: bifunctional 23S rRNA (guanine(2069)-N(7))-methyltransferase RlmK/23S rRNA (guanine(2445)-N(2))-methyltransferase RlmL, partial [Oscillospiraceae bacterium]|nr:bifunctional 23S rRNA (guanine(2069)-N(7))-methyltransferase RlmK/23S rRNA (guanine(2445)-N(2))-methyltransferase RlmL [Oscillospiraceae bacterium]
MLAEELGALGVRKVRPLKGGATFYGKPAAALRVCLWSRLAGRVSCTVGRAGARNAEALYGGVRGLAWEDEVAEGATIAVKVSGTNAALRNTQFTALKVKDAVCDRLAEVRGARPDVDPHSPDCLIEVRLRDDKATVSVDLSGAALTHRSYLMPEDGDDAPLAVAQAAALLASLHAGEALRAGWGLFDPVCDDGILLCEAASVATDQAPGLLRERWGFTGWVRFAEEAWDDLLAEADDRLEAGMAALLGCAPSTEALSSSPDQEQVRIVGVSASSPAVARARAHLRRAGLRAVASAEAARTEDAADVEMRLARVVARAASGATALLVATAAPVSHADDDARAVAEAGAFLAAARRA